MERVYVSPARPPCYCFLFIISYNIQSIISFRHFSLTSHFNEYTRYFPLYQTLASAITQTTRQPLQTPGPYIKTPSIMQYSIVILVAALAGSAFAAPMNGTTSAVVPSSTPVATWSCDAQENACRTGPNANQAFCSSQRAQCDSGCSAQRTTCDNAVNANHASCAALFQTCEHGNGPISSSTSISSTSSTSSSIPTPPAAQGCDGQENACRTAPNANQAFCSAQRAQCDATCQQQRSDCDSAPNANHAFCSSQWMGCEHGNGTSTTTTSVPPVTQTTTTTTTSTITSTITITTLVPTSSPVATQAGTTIFTTWLSTRIYTTVSTFPTTVVQTLTPANPTGVAPPAVVTSPAGTPAPAPAGCPPASTVTVYLANPAAGNPSGPCVNCQTITYTDISGGSQTIIIPGSPAGVSTSTTLVTPTSKPAGPTTTSSSKPGPSGSGAPGPKKAFPTKF